ncbi:MAG TPA: PepSY-associated TM helix domain-containing protein [Vicinamibacteria bacterium]|nr:PepSY-associated TM helix domain-containing protein [Vicinamibacteria bacterium]
MFAILLSLHRWAGLLAGLVIFVIALTGCALVFEEDIDRLLNRELTVVVPGPAALSVQAGVDAVRAAHAGETATGVVLPERPHYALVVVLENDQAVSVDPYRGHVLGSRDRLGGFARFLRRLHKTLLAGDTGATVVGVLTLLTLLMAVSGTILWWPRRILGVKSSRSWRRVNFDLHNVLGFYSAVFLVVMCVSGVMITWAGVTDPLVLRLNSSPPGERMRPTSTPREGATPIGPDEALRRGRAALPGAFVARLGLPSSATAVYRLGMMFPEDRTPGGRSFVVLDQYSGDVLDLKSSRAAELGTKILDLKRSIHTGDVLGAPTRALAFVVSLMLAGQVVTGYLIWWRPGRFALAGSRQKQRESPSPPRSSAAMPARARVSG